MLRVGRRRCRGSHRVSSLEAARTAVNGHSATRAEANWRARRRWSGLQTRLVDLQAQPVAPDQLVVGETRLDVLGDHVDVLEVTLEDVALVDRGRPGGVVDGVD